MATVHLVGTRNGWAGPAEERDGHEAQFGEWLRRAREARGLTLERITKETRIPQRHLEAIEGGNLSLLPEFYQRSEVRAIARVVGLDEQTVLARLDSALTPLAPAVEVPPAQPAKPARRGTPSAALTIGTVVLGTFVLGAMSGWWLATQAVVDTRGTRGSVLAEAPLPLGAPTAAQAPGIAASAVSSDIALDDTLVGAPGSSPAPPAGAAELLVTTEPSGARVTVNGIGWGTTPVVIRHLQPGDKRIRVSKDGYHAAERALALDAGGSQSVAIELAALP